MRKPIIIAIILSLGVAGCFTYLHTRTLLGGKLGGIQCVSVDGLPDKTCTPGIINPDITQANLKTTICDPRPVAKGGWTTAMIRPPTSYTNKLKIQQIKEYGYKDTNLSHYEEDHLISLQLGGSPKDPKNLWPESPASPNPKDKIETRCNKLVCNGTITLAEAQKEISTDWRNACQ